MLSCPLPNKRYVAGSNFERRVKKEYAARGWLSIRAAGSHGIVDVVAVKGGIIELVQCKTGGVISTEDLMELINAAEIAGGTAKVAYRVGRKLFIKEAKSLLRQRERR